MANRKGQEEIVGFVIIVILVSVIGVVFLGISLRNNSDVQYNNDEEISAFIDGVHKITTNCTKGSNYLTLGESFKECASSRSSQCNGKSICEEVSSIVKGSIESAWLINENASRKGYIFNSSYQTSSGESQLLLVKGGTCAESYIGSYKIIPTGNRNESIVNTLRICY